jgi:hypothetical protein
MVTSTQAHLRLSWDTLVTHKHIVCHYATGDHADTDHISYIIKPDSHITLPHVYIALYILMRLRILQEIRYYGRGNKSYSLDLTISHQHKVADNEDEHELGVECHKIPHIPRNQIMCTKINDFLFHHTISHPLTVADDNEIQFAERWVHGAVRVNIHLFSSWACITRNQIICKRKQTSSRYHNITSYQHTVADEKEQELGVEFNKIPHRYTRK